MVAAAATAAAAMAKRNILIIPHETFSFFFLRRLFVQLSGGNRENRHPNTVIIELMLNEVQIARRLCVCVLLALSFVLTRMVICVRESVKVHWRRKHIVRSTFASRSTWRTTTTTTTETTTTTATKRPLRLQFGFNRLR